MGGGGLNLNPKMFEKLFLSLSLDLYQEGWGARYKPFEGICQTLVLIFYKKRGEGADQNSFFFR